ncbi:uncharacterized protein LTR77_000671 [Saxophila tyrrhenica]|uniref:Uncharacterized protein n=1 Tax=Saxophila tyrrhenica TaxID=1690608 RepID=A0AAV9PNZ9_9PEZI|nr:hypothetical protein LTR77_000671 [Saxophila tyrrhenica]
MTPLEPVKTKYAKDYLEAADLFDKDDFYGCQATCKHNLGDPTLPPFWRLKNYALHISASSSWDEAEEWYQSTLARCDPESEGEQVEAACLRLADLLFFREKCTRFREDLDQIKGWQEEDRPRRHSKEEEKVSEEGELGGEEPQKAKPEEELRAANEDVMMEDSESMDMKAEARRVQ